MWLQSYDPLGNQFLSTVVAALPVVVLLGAIGVLQIRIHVAALLGLFVALAVAIFVYRMPASAALASAGYGAAYGLLPIGWIILNLIFLYQLTVKKGAFDVLREHLASFVPDKRVQLILIAFSFGAFFEGAAGFGTPVAITAAMLMQLGFRPLQASALSLVANTAPVAYGSLGTPIIALSGVTGLDQLHLSAMIGRQLPFFSLIVPFWVVWAYAGLRGTLQVWPAALTAGVAFAVPQFLVSNFHGPWLVDVVGSVSSMIALVVLLKFWHPRPVAPDTSVAPAVPARRQNNAAPPESASPTSRLRVFLAWLPWVLLTFVIFRLGRLVVEGRPVRIWLPWELLSAVIFIWGLSMVRHRVVRAWLPWVLLSVVIFHWGLPHVKSDLNSLSEPKFNVPALHNVVLRDYPVVPKPTLDTPTKSEEAVFKLSWLSATGSGILVAAVLAGLLMGFSPLQMLRTYGETLVRVRFSLLTIAAMLALGYVTKYSGTDATLGLALAKTGVLYPFFGTLLGWLGVALTGSDTASNVLFGSLQKITASQVGVSATLMCAANSSGGVMGKMIDAQSIVVASTATNFYGHEGSILRVVFFHSLALAALVGILVMLQAYVFPFTEMVVR
jgi:lactate permease